MAAIDAAGVGERGPTVSTVPDGPLATTGGRARDDPGLLDVLDQLQPGAEARFDALRELGQRASDSAGAFQGGLEALSSWHKLDMVRRTDLLGLLRDERVERQEAAFGWIRVAAAAVSLVASIALVALVVGGGADPLRVGSLFALALGGVVPTLARLLRSAGSVGEQKDPPAPGAS